MKTRNKVCRLFFLIIVTVYFISSNKLVWANLPEGDNNISQTADEKAYDAPDQVVWHAPSKTWFISNLGAEFLSTEIIMVGLRVQTKKGL